MKNINDLILRSQLTRVEPKKTSINNPAVNKPTTSESFDAILDKSLSFSKHAVKRLQTRQIEMNEIDKSKLNQAVDSLEKKGAKDSLVLMGELAFVVNVPSRTVVTAIQKEQMEEQIFTNIDSTMLVS